MRACKAMVLAVLVGIARASGAVDVSPPPNPAIDMPGFLSIANEAAAYRETRRVTEDEFIAMSREPGT